MTPTSSPFQTIDGLGHTLFERSAQFKPRFFERLLNQVNGILAKEGHESLLNAVMRFTDVLPEIEHNTASIHSHFSAYFRSLDRSDFSAGLRFLLFCLQKIASPRLFFLKGLIGLNARFFTRKMATHFIAGKTASEALTVARALAQDRLVFTGDLLQEAVVTESEAQAMVALYKDFVTKLASDSALRSSIRQKRTQVLPSKMISFAEEHQLDFEVSLKLSAFYSQWDPKDPQGTASVIQKRVGEIFRSCHGVRKTARLPYWRDV